MSEKQNIFRKEVLEELNSPDEMSKSIKVTRPSVYLILFTASLMAVVLILWLFMGSVSDKAQIGGMVFPNRDAQCASIPNDGVVRSVFVHAGDYVHENQTLALVSVEKAYSIVSAPCSGVVLQTKNENDAVHAFQPIVSINKQDTAQITHHLTAFADFRTQRKLRKGMEVQVSPVNMPREKYGYVTGRIVDIAHYSLTREQALERLKMVNFLEGMFPEEGSGFEVKIELDLDSKHAGALHWSSRQPKDADLSIGTFCDVQIITTKRSMFDFLFEQVRESLNTLTE